MSGGAKAQHTVPSSAAAVVAAQLLSKRRWQTAADPHLVRSFCTRKLTLLLSLFYRYVVVAP